MACDTFLKISQKCKRQFIIQHLEEDEPFIEYILRCLHAITVDLSSEQVCFNTQQLDMCLYLIRSSLYMKQ